MVNSDLSEIEYWVGKNELLFNAVKTKAVAGNVTNDYNVNVKNQSIFLLSIKQVVLSYLY